MHVAVDYLAGFVLTLSLLGQLRAGTPSLAGLRFLADPVGGFSLFAEGERDGGVAEPECLALSARGPVKWPRPVGHASSIRQWPPRLHPGARWDPAMRSSQSPSRARSAGVSAVRSGSAARKVTA